MKLDTLIGASAGQGGARSRDNRAEAASHNRGEGVPTRIL